LLPLWRRAWIVPFSTVDFVKESGRSRWWSVSAIGAGQHIVNLHTIAILHRSHPH
jgi:hypothetical protein